MSTVGKLIAAAVLGAVAVSVLSRLVATRGRNAALTPIRYTAPSLSSVAVLTAGLTSTSRGTTSSQFGWAVRYKRES